jgi:tetratricopeptide (TPR) repeat protein
MRRKIEDFGPKAEAAAHRAIQLDSNLADAYLALGALESRRGNLVASEELRLKALALDPNNPVAMRAYIPLLANVGRLKEALAMAQQLHALEPYAPVVNNDVGEILWVNGEDAAAIEMLLPIIDVGRVRSSLAMIYASQGRYKEAADLLELNLPAFMPELYARLSRTAAGILRTAPAKAASPESLPELCACALGFVYLYVGAPERSLEYYENVIESGSVGGSGSDTAFLWHPSYAPVRKLERFKTFVRKSGLVDYWRVKGWPEFCRPTGADDFVCD